MSFRLALSSAADVDENLTSKFLKSLRINSSLDIESKIQVLVRLKKTALLMIELLKLCTSCNSALFLDISKVSKTMAEENSKLLSNFATDIGLTVCKFFPHAVF